MLKIIKETLTTGRKRKIAQSAFKREMIKHWECEETAQGLVEQVIGHKPYETEKYKYYAEDQDE